MNQEVFSPEQVIYNFQQISQGQTKDAKNKANNFIFRFIVSYNS